MQHPVDYGLSASVDLLDCLDNLRFPSGRLKAKVKALVMSQGADAVEVAVQETSPGPGLGLGLGPSPRRSSIEKPPILEDSDFDDVSDDEHQPTAFDALPEEIIQQ